MSQQNADYRQILKATSIFGGVKVFQIIIGIIRSKFIAVLLGPTGMGVSGLLQSGLLLISGLTNFGLTTSAIRSISVAYSDGNNEKIGIIISVFRKLVWATGIFGLILVLIFSPYLSKLSFGNDNFTWAFYILSITLLIDQLSAGQSVLLRATRQISQMAKASIFGSIFGLLLTIPLYFYFGQEGIVPGLLLSSFISFLLSWYFSSKLGIVSKKTNFETVKREGKEMIITGLMISLNNIIVLACAFGVRIFINHYGSVTDVGFYNAGFAIINTYVGMIFTAMAADYYPKLVSQAKNLQQVNLSVNYQAEIAILILGPVLIIFISFIEQITNMLYSDAFAPINLMIIFAAAGMIFKAFSWSVAFLFLAHGANKAFIWNEVMSNTYMLLFNLIGYYFFGLTGLGVAFFLGYLIYTIQVYFVCNKLFKFTISRSLVKITIINTTLILCALYSGIFLSNMWVGYLLDFALLAALLFYNLIELNKKLLIKTWLIKQKK